MLQPFSRKWHQRRRVRLLVGVLAVFGIALFVLTRRSGLARLEQEEARLRAAGKAASLQELQQRANRDADPEDGETTKAWRAAIDLAAADPEATTLPLARFHLDPKKLERELPLKPWKHASSVASWLAAHSKLEAAVEPILNSDKPPAMSLLAHHVASQLDDSTLLSFFSQILRYRLWQASAAGDKDRASQMLDKVWRVAEISSHSLNDIASRATQFEAAIATEHSMRALQRTEAELAGLQQRVARVRPIETRARQAEINRLFLIHRLRFICDSGLLVAHNLSDTAFGFHYIHKGFALCDIGDGLMEQPIHEALREVARKDLLPPTWIDQAAALLTTASKEPLFHPTHLSFVLRSVCTVEAKLRCLEAALAVERFRIASGRLPATLDELMPGQLKKVPIDPYTGGPVLLRIERNVYWIDCVGPDGVHDPTPKSDDVRCSLDPKAE